MNRSDSIVKIAAALLKAQKEMGNATKDSKNPFFKSKYADLNAIREAAIPVLNTHGISVLQPTTPGSDMAAQIGQHNQYVETTLLHESGEYISSLTQIVCAKPNDPQAYGSAVSYARRYGLQALVCIGAEDDDGEAGMGRGNKFTAAANSTPIVEKLSSAAQSLGLNTDTNPAAETPQAPKKGFGKRFGSKAT